jgi:hypothetical protein
VIDPEEPEILGPLWAHLHPRDEESLRAIHDDYLRVARVASKRDLRYVPASRVLEEGDLVAWTQVSPSQIETYNKCNRLWFFKSVMRVPELQKGNQALGEGVHLIIENVEKMPKGEIPRAGYEYTHEEVPTLDAPGWDKAKQLAALMVPYIPRSRNGIQVLREQKITLPTYPGGPTMLGYMDLGVPSGIGWPELMIPTHAAIIGDYKTLSDFKYMRTPEELADSVQMMTYAKWAISDMPGRTVNDLDTLPGETAETPVYLAHLYGRTKPPFTRSSVRNSVALVTPSQINAKWEKTLDTVRSMDHDARASDAQDVQATGVFNDHCSAYGGCAFRDRCGLNQPNPIANLFGIRKSASSSPTESKDMSDVAGGSLAAKLAEAKARLAAQQQAQTASNPAPAATAPAPAATPAPAPVAPTHAPAPASAPLSSATPNKGPISELIIKIENLHGGSKPALAGLIALLYAKEQGIEFKPGASLASSGHALAGVTCRTKADLEGLITASAPAPVATAPVVQAAPVPSTVASGIVPADAPPRTQSVITKPGDGQDPIKANAGVGGEPGVAGVTEDDEEGEGETGQETPQVVAGGPPPAKRGRRSNAEIAAEKAAQEAAREAEIERRVIAKLEALGIESTPTIDLDAQKVIEQVTAERDQAVREKKSLEAKINASQRTSGPIQGFTLYVDCYPFKGTPEGIQDYLEFYAPIAQVVAEQNGQADWRLIDYKGKGFLATAMRVAAQAGLPPAMAISRDMPGADIALEVLSPLARQIIRRF